MTSSNTLARAGLLGAASGLRSFAGVGTIAALNAAPGRPATVFGNKIARPLIVLLAVQELVLDKLPSTPARVEALGLATRMIGAVGSGAALALSESDTTPEPTADANSERPDETKVDIARVAFTAAVSAAAAGLSAWAGLHYRGWTAKQFGHDWPGATLEDATAVGLALAGLRTAIARTAGDA